MKICIITAGGAGMFCGSCMQDNTLVRALRLAGADAVLLPTYTPIRVDEDSTAGERVFLGGINVYLDSRLPGWKWLPRPCKRWLDSPAVVRLLSRFGSSTQAADLGPLTVDMLHGSLGPCNAAITELVQFIADGLRPDLVIFSNALLSGVVPELRRRWNGKLLCLIQGDDIFLKDLPEPFQTQALQLIQQNSRHFDGFLAHSHYYADFMSGYLSIDRTRFHCVPLAVEDRPPQPADAHTATSLAATSATAPQPPSPSHRSGPLTVGYFARICPEKGAFQFLDAAAAVLKTRSDIRFSIAGYLPKQHRRSFLRQLALATEAAPDRLQWHGSPPDRQQKFQLLAQLDWLCVPTTYREPKGLYVLEAALAGVPCLLPDHGAFPERVATLRCGTLFHPGSQSALETALLNLQPVPSDVSLQLRQRCLEQHGLKTAGAACLQVFNATLAR